MREEASDPADVVSWEERRLCPDGSCVGVVGDDGACNACGRVDPEAARRIDERAERGAAGEEGAAVEGAAEPRAVRETSEEGSAGRGAASDEAASDGDDWQQRKLCEDGACIGVVIDGRCTTCGKAQ